MALNFIKKFVCCCCTTNLEKEAEIAVEEPRIEDPDREAQPGAK